MKTEEFKLTSKHLKLLSETCTSWWDCEFGAPCIDPKRPYGNSDVVTDISELIGNKKPEDELSEEKIDEYCQLHKETEIALQIVLQNIGKKNLTGTWIQEDYGSKWKKQK